jgi:hypothetical protein
MMFIKKVMFCNLEYACENVALTINRVPYCKVTGKVKRRSVF